MQRPGRILRDVIVLAVALPGLALGAGCPGDCDNNGAVTTDELVKDINIALDRMPMDRCQNADPSGNGAVTVDEITMAVTASLKGCKCATSTQPAFTSTFDAIQKSIFDRYGCNAEFCHSGPLPQANLDLTPGNSYRSLLGADGQGAPSFDLPTMRRVLPGDKDRSFLYLKLAAKTDPTLIPDHTDVPGSPMPNNQYALTKDELEAVRLWIYTAAPETGTVNGTQQLLNACLPDPKPIIIEPLPPPDTNTTGVQFAMPPWNLPAHSEYELCFATYYDISGVVPEQFQDPSHTYFRFSGQELRQDPQSHHLILNLSAATVDQIHDPSFGDWTCNGGETPGQICEPTNINSCGTGICTSALQHDFACIGFGPKTGGGGGIGGLLNAIGGAQKAQANETYAPGVFAQIPMKGILYWNSHAFNLTDQATTMHARLNYYYADPNGGQKFPLQPIFNIQKIFSQTTPPFATETLCNDQPLPPGAQLFTLSSHTHKRGVDFWTELPGTTPEKLYENFIYNDPPNKRFDPPMSFPSGGTLHYCSMYNNGVAEDGSPDPSTVTRLSKIPPQGFKCKPTACAAGKIGAPCNYQNAAQPDNASCDTASGKGDGLCDACKITGGESTENEMFILIGSYYVDTSKMSAASAAATTFAADIDESGRSTYTELALPPVIGCGSSHAGHDHSAQ